MRKTKIICTLGPSTDSPEILQAMMENGMDVARFNFSHGSHDEHKRRLEELKALRKKLNLPVAALLDTKGPEIRLRGRSPWRPASTLPSRPGRSSVPRRFQREL